MRYRFVRHPWSVSISSEMGAGLQVRTLDDDMQSLQASLSLTSRLMIRQRSDSVP